VDHGYIGLRARGRGFAELWSLEPAIENNVILETKIFLSLIPFQNHSRRMNMHSKKFYHLNFSSYSILKFVMLTSGDAVGDTAGDAAGNASGNAAGNTAGDAVGDAVGDAASDAIDDAVGDNASDAIGDAVGDSAGDAVGDSAGDAAGDPADEPAAA
jgi:hypothetical protein